MGGTPIDQRIINWKALHHAAKQPTYGSEEAAGADLYANIKLTGGADNFEMFTLQPGERKLIKTGVAIELPPGTWAEVRGRSGLAYKNGIAILGGVIDSDYRGDIGVIMHNTSDVSFVVNHHDRIAQLIIVPYVRGVYAITDNLGDSDRGEKGFGSTGR